MYHIDLSFVLRSKKRSASACAARSNSLAKHLTFDWTPLVSAPRVNLLLLRLLEALHLFEQRVQVHLRLALDAHLLLLAL